MPIRPHYVGPTRTAPGATPAVNESLCATVLGVGGLRTLLLGLADPFASAVLVAVVLAVARGRGRRSERSRTGDAR